MQLRELWQRISPVSDSPFYGEIGSELAPVVADRDSLDWDPLLL